MANPAEQYFFIDEILADPDGGERVFEVHEAGRGYGVTRPEMLKVLLNDMREGDYAAVTYFSGPSRELRKVSFASAGEEDRLVPPDQFDEVRRESIRLYHLDEALVGLL